MNANGEVIYAELRRAMGLRRPAPDCCPFGDSPEQLAARRKANAASSSHLGEVAALAAKHRLPTFYYSRDFVDAGGLMAYTPDLAVQFRRAADYVDKILKGAKPGDLPIEQPTQYQLIVNLTAKALGLTIPESIPIRADEVIR